MRDVSLSQPLVNCGENFSSDSDGKHFGILHPWMLRVLSVLPGKRTVLVYVALVAYANADGVAWPSQTRLAVDTGMDVRAVQRALRDLREAGALRVEHVRPGGVCVYRLVRHDAPPVELTVPPVESTPGQSDRGTPGGVDRGTPGAFHRDPPGGFHRGEQTNEQNREQTKEQTIPSKAEPARVLELVQPEEVDGVAKLFAVWQEVTGHPRARLDDKRKAILRKAAKAYGIEDCERAIRGIARSDWHMGRDQGTGGKNYNELDNVFRSAAHVERFIALAQEQDKPKAVDFEQMTQRWQDFANEFYRARGDNLHRHDGIVLPEFDKFRDGLRPVGRDHVLGEAVLVFGHTELLWFSNNAAAARYAGKKLRQSYDDHELAVWLAEKNEQGAAEDLRACYARACAALEEAA